MDHNHGDMTTTMDTASPAAAAATATATPSSGGMGSGSGCKISMLWNWNTIDSCFLARTWRITSPGMFAGSCIGVIFLVMSLEMLRRAVKEWDHYLVRTHRAKYAVVEGDRGEKGSDSGGSCPTIPAFRPNLWQQIIRAFLHMCQFAVAYFVMLLAMYYNGYIIICIFIGAFLGSFVFQWEHLTAAGLGNTSATNQATVCCG